MCACGGGGGGEAVWQPARTFSCASSPLGVPCLPVYVYTVAANWGQTTEPLAASVVLGLRAQPQLVRQYAQLLEYHLFMPRARGEPNRPSWVR